MANKRNVLGNKTQDPASIAAIQYNEKAGAQKQLTVGPSLMPLPGNVTVANAAPVNIGMGKIIAIYNNSGTLATVAFGADNTVTVGAAGSLDGSNNPSIPCKPNDWTYLSNGEKPYILTSAATLLTFLVDDDTLIQPGR
jgi:hypothetical protein